MLPSNKPRLTLAEMLEKYPQVRDYMKRSTHLFLVMIPGYFSSMGKPGENDRGIYDDGLFVISPRRSELWSFNANTDPTRIREKTPNLQGIATLKHGIHPYRQGKHGMSKPGGGYPAFRPATDGEKLPVFRDGDPNKDAYGVAINIHMGGHTTTSSEGCQTLPPSQWSDFYAIVTGEQKALQQPVFDLIKI